VTGLFHFANVRFCPAQFDLADRHGERSLDNPQRGVLPGMIEPDRNHQRDQQECSRYDPTHHWRIQPSRHRHGSRIAGGVIVASTPSREPFAACKVAA
jgi:hypothetical protein